MRVAESAARRIATNEEQVDKAKVCIIS